MKEIGDLPVIRCQIHYEDAFIEAHILFDPGSATPMVIHEKTVGGFGLTPREATGALVDIEFPGSARWKAIPMQVDSVPFLETVTAKYARELKEVPVVAVVGLSAVGSRVVELDLRKGWLRTRSLASDDAAIQPPQPMTQCHKHTLQSCDSYF